MRDLTGGWWWLLLAALLLPGSAIAGRGGSPVRFDVEYAGVELAARRLSLSNDTPISDMEAVPVEGSYSGSGGSSDEKNPMVALLLSCAVPGLGEMYAGEMTRGRWFLASEAAIWMGYGAFKLQESMRIDDYEEYAAIFGGAGPGAGSDYLSDMGDYIRSEGDNSYNESVRSDARSLFPDDLEAQAQYLQEHGYFGDDAWDWETKEAFLKYRDLRKEASRSERNAFYMTGLAVLNRAISAIDSAWMARRNNSGLRGEPSARLSVRPEFSRGDVGGTAMLEVSF